MAAGLPLLQTQGPQVDVVVSDVMMPRVSGQARLAQARHASLEVPFLFITGHADEAEAASAQSGARLLHKRCTPAQLVDAVAALAPRRA